MQLWAVCAIWLISIFINPSFVQASVAILSEKIVVRIA
jgi:hypothetical protein